MSNTNTADLTKELEILKKNLFLAYRLTHDLKDLKEKELESSKNVKAAYAHGHYEWKLIKEEPPQDGIAVILGWMDSPYGSDILGDIAYRKSTSKGIVWCKSSTHDVLVFSSLGEPTHWCLAPKPPKRAMQVISE